MKLMLGRNSKVVVFVVLLLAFNNKGFSQKSVKNAVLETKKARNFGEVEAKPEFQGGIEKFYKFVGNNFKISDKEPSGKIIAKFIIETDGGLSNIEIVKNEVGILSGEEFIRVLKICPKWIPGSDNGVPVRVLFSVPITVQTAK